MKRFLLPTLAGMVSATAFAQYTPQSSWITDPESILPYLKESADFWLPAYDTEFGGFFSNVDLQGMPSDMVQKDTVIQSRDAYGMVKAFQVTGDVDYLAYADGALRFLYENGWNEDGGGWWGTVDREGEVMNPGGWFNSDIWSFWQHYNLLGPLNYAEATDEVYHWDEIARMNQANDDVLWDDTEGIEGYFNYVQWGGGNPSGKGFTPTIDAITTNAMANYLYTRDEFRKQRFREVAMNAVDYLAGNMDASGVTLGFPSEFDEDWDINRSETSSSIGHTIKTAWCLARAQLILAESGETVFADAAEKILDEVVSSGMLWESTGTPRASYSWTNGNISGDGDWWTVEQAFTGGIMNYYVHGKDSYLEMADDAIDFFMEYYYDYENGEVFSVVNNQGQVTQNNKGDRFKGAYHGIELFFYVWMYSNLYYNHEPVALFYDFETSTESRDISLWPLAIEDEKLKIGFVETKDGSFTDFDADTRTITVPANFNGLMRVTFYNSDGDAPAAPPELYFGTEWPDEQPGTAYPVADTPWDVSEGFEAGWYQEFVGWTYLNAGFLPWAYHYPLGWVASLGNDSAGVWFYSMHEEIGFFYASDTLPAGYFYSYAQNAWLTVESTDSSSITLRKLSDNSTVTIDL